MTVDNRMADNKACKCLEPGSVIYGGFAKTCGDCGGTIEPTPSRHALTRSIWRDQDQRIKERLEEFDRPRQLVSLGIWRDQDRERNEKLKQQD
jgi:hypothetical protein